MNEGHIRATAGGRIGNRDAEVTVSSNILAVGVHLVAQRRLGEKKRTRYVSRSSDRGIGDFFAVFTAACCVAQVRRRSFRARGRETGRRRIGAWAHRERRFLDAGCTRTAQPANVCELQTRQSILLPEGSLRVSVRFLAWAFAPPEPLPRWIAPMYNTRNADWSAGTVFPACWFHGNGLRPDR